MEKTEKTIKTEKIKNEIFTINLLTNIHCNRIIKLLNKH